MISFDKKNKSRIVVLGASESGTGAAVLAKKNGIDVFVSDMYVIKNSYKNILKKYKISYEEKWHSENKILNADEIIKSPGIPDTASIIEKIREHGIPIISEIEFAWRYTKAKTICVTGTNGKSTTAMLIYHILNSAKFSVALVGNIGKSFALCVAENDYDYYVIELSSFQLDNMYCFKADIAILLNITSDHLDRYEYKMKNYVDSKMRIIQNQTKDDIFIYSNDDLVIIHEIKKKCPVAALYPFSYKKKRLTKAYMESDFIKIDTHNNEFIINKRYITLQGKHNLYNFLAAAMTAKLLNVSNKILKNSFLNFKTVEHRMEKVISIGNVDYINDSKSTNVNSCLYALQSLKTPIVLILGGIDKGNDYSAIKKIVIKKCKALIFLGLNNFGLHSFFDKKINTIHDATSMQEAVKYASELAQNGDTVLLSPCCSSFDLFKNYEDRGNQFKKCVYNLVP
ncbi:MAG: UDP-N-acetylmuramoyl-L-alanine--D-glutamate ligase [Bacteroidales bacterium OttesenSCG-928-I14]|jgi:UDP-N-acetylmuramoylalanine--D-glutamate ligase|nr:UDP-N-acetylmuramoyl-L-alanine--D-glutamate ligase [Bacteroidales bacterium OttesenSCG-928-I14]